MEIDELNSDIESLMADALAERDENVEKEEEKNFNEEGKSEDDINDKDTKDEDKDDNDEDGEKDKSNESQSEDNSDKDKDKEESDDSIDFEPVVVKVNGQDIKLESVDEVKAYLSNSQKNEIQKPDSIEKSIIDQAKITDIELRLLADVKAGKPGAIKQLAELSKIDLADADEFEGEYKPEFTPEIKSDVDMIINSIEKNPELNKKFSEAISNVPDEFLNVVGSDARSLAQFTKHVDEGIAQKLIPLVNKEIALNGGDFLDTYIRLGNENYNKKNESKEEKPKREVSDFERRVRNKAIDNADQNKSGSSSELSVDDIWNDDILEKVKKGEINLRDLA